jgi:hypothetical protein
MTFTGWVVVTAAALFAGMLLCIEVGHRFGRSWLARHPGDHSVGSGPVQAAVFGLLGLLLAFTFSGAASRFEGRRHLITEEANAIGTAYLRVDLLPSDAQAGMRQLFRDYLDARIEVHRLATDLVAMEAKRAEAAQWQQQIWDAAVAATGRPDARVHAAQMVVPSLNAMFDMATTRIMATQNHPPRIIFVLLAGLSLLTSLLVGYALAENTLRNWFQMLLVATTISVVFGVILDLESPRHGLIRIDAADHVLMELRSTMQTP